MKKKINKWKRVRIVSCVVLILVMVGSMYFFFMNFRDALEVHLSFIKTPAEYNIPILGAIVVCSLVCLTCLWFFSMAFFFIHWIVGELP